MADKENKKVSARSKILTAVSRRKKIDETKPTSSNRDPLKTLSGQNTENCLAGPSHTSRANFARHVTLRNKKYEDLDWNLEVLNKHPTNRVVEDVEDKESVLENSRQSSIKTTEEEISPLLTQKPLDADKGLEKLEENVHTLTPVNKIYHSAVSISSDITYSAGLQQQTSCFDYLCRDYALDNLKYLLTIERNIPGQRIIRQNSRTCLINWIININGSSGNPAIVQLASWYLDWYMTTTEVSMDKLQVIAAACYWIAAKTHGRCISSYKLVKYSNYAFIEKELSEVERNLLRKMVFPSLQVNPHDFVSYLSWCCDQSGTGVVEAAATFLCQCGVMINKNFNEEYPSAIAAAAVKNALILLRQHTSSMENLKASMIYKACEKKTSNINRICAQLSMAVRLVSSVDFKYKGPLFKFTGPPHYIANKIVRAVNSQFLVAFDMKKKTKQYDECLKLCAVALQGRNDKMIEFIQLRAMTIKAKIAGNGYEEVECFPQQEELTTTAIAKTARPGTMFQREVRTAQTNRQPTATATLRSRGVTSTARARSSRTALFTASRVSRAATALAGGAPFTAGTPLSLRFLTKDDKHFVPSAKTILEYVYYCEGDVRKALDVAAQAQKADETADWWWSYSIARCYYTLGLYRNAEECLRQALKMNRHISIYLRLVAMYVGLNQPLSALEVCKQGLSVFHEYTPLLIEQARIHDQMGNSTLAIKEYRKVALENLSNMEAIASIATYNFYNDQPEIALRYYRRLLATTPTGSEIYNNLGIKEKLKMSV